MRCLPPLDVGLFRWALPMADASAAALAEFLATGNGDGLADVLRGDPPLLVWTVHHLLRRENRPADSVADAARWLADHALEALDWPSPDDASFRHVQATADVWAGRVAAAVELAELAAQSAGENQAGRDAAFCGGLLHYAADWLQCDAATFANAAKRPCATPEGVPLLRQKQCEPGAPGGTASDEAVAHDRIAGSSQDHARPLNQAFFSSATPTVEAAAKILADKAMAGGGKAVAQAVEAADRWRQEIAGPADWLPQLAAPAWPGSPHWRKALRKRWNRKNSPPWPNLPRGRDMKSTTP